MHIKDCSVIISGGASGMGEATARMLSSLGAKVAIFDRNLARAKQVATDIQGMAFECDVISEASVATAIEAASKQLGPARVCINCAGIVAGRRMVNQQGPMPLDEFKKIIDVNLIGTFNLMRLAAAEMIKLDPINETGERGVIINTASVAAYEGQIGQTAYSASKGAIVSLTLPAARELAQFGIRVMAIAPGLVETPMMGDITPEARESLVKTLVFPKRLARPHEFAQLVLQIIDNSMLNGEVIRLDGALRLQPK